MYNRDPNQIVNLHQLKEGSKEKEKEIQLASIGL
jgi:hypothetical protein